MGKRRIVKIGLPTDDKGKTIEIDDGSDFAAELRERLDRDEFLSVALAALSPREYAVLVGRFVHDRKLKEVGEQIGVTRERVRQIEKQALAKCRERIRTYKLTGSTTLERFDVSEFAAA